MRQVVVRLQSKQSLSRIVSGTTKGQKDTIIQGSGEAKDVTEYLVIQRRMLRGAEGPWVIWGTTNESDVADVAAGKSVPTTI